MPPHRVTTLSGGALLLAALLIAGCGGSGPLTAEQREKAKGTLEQVLTAWKNGDPLKKWSAKSGPVVVEDHDWRAGNKLTDFRLVKLEGTEPGVAKAVAHLSLQPKKGPGGEVDALYAIDFRNPGKITVARDPMQ